jgi:hypothetical protein
VPGVKVPAAMFVAISTLKVTKELEARAFMIPAMPSRMPVHSPKYLDLVIIM